MTLRSGGDLGQLPREELPRLRLDRRTERGASRAVGDRRRCGGDERSRAAPWRRRFRAGLRRSAACALRPDRSACRVPRRAEHVAQVVGDLIGLADLLAERPPGLRIDVRPTPRPPWSRRRTARRSWPADSRTAGRWLRIPRPDRRRFRAATRRPPRRSRSGARAGPERPRAPASRTRARSGRRRSARPAARRTARGRTASRVASLRRRSWAGRRERARRNEAARPRPPRRRSRSGEASPQAAATARHSCGRIRCPPGNTA